MNYFKSKGIFQFLNFSIFQSTIILYFLIFLTSISHAQSGGVFHNVSLPEIKGISFTNSENGAITQNSQVTVTVQNHEESAVCTPFENIWLELHVMNKPKLPTELEHQNFQNNANPENSIGLIWSQRQSCGQNNAQKQFVFNISDLSEQCHVLSRLYFYVRCY